jgi:DNA gyrase subunit A
VYEIPEGAKATKGRPIQNVINIPSDDKIKAFLNINNLKDPEYLENNFIIMVTKNGVIKKTSLEAYSRPRANGINAITVRDGDELLQACLTDGESEIVIAKRKGKAIRFSETKVRPMGRTAAGVRGVTLEDESDEVIGMVCVNPVKKATTILVVSEKGYGKRTDLDDYRVTGRGGKGVKTISITEKTGNLVGILEVTDEDGLMIINKSGMTIRMATDKLRVMGRAAQGVRLINIKDKDAIANIAKTPREDDEEEMDGELVDGIVVVEGEVGEVQISDETIQNLDDSTSETEDNSTEENNED